MKNNNEKTINYKFENEHKVYCKYIEDINDSVKNIMKILI